MNHITTIMQAITEYDRIILHRHVRPDPDALGSQLGLKAILQGMYPEKQIYAAGETEAALAFLGEMDEVSDDMYKGALVIVLDTANEERIDDQRYRLGDKLIKIDHHPDREPFGDVSWVDTEFSSTSEMMVELTELSQLQLNDEAAFLLYSGIVGDTGRFLYNNTSWKTHQYAGRLLEYNVEPSRLYHELYKTSRNIAQLHGSILLNHDRTDHGVAYAHITKELREQFQVTSTEAANLVNVLANIEGNHIWIFFIEEDDVIRVRIRSKETTINEVAVKYNGGGHPLASGASVSSWEEADRLVADLENLLV